MGKGQNVENHFVKSQKKNIESLKFEKDQNVERSERRKFEKDQNLKSQRRLSTFWSLLTP